MSDGPALNAALQKEQHILSDVCDVMVEVVEVPVTQQPHGTIYENA
jgi:hypothetical protein